jgi:hypothetical protein
MLVISYKGDMYKFIKKDETETTAIFRDRCWWIVKNIDSKNYDLDKLMSLSNIYVAMKYYGVSYDENIIEMMKTFKDVYDKQ